MLLVPDNLFPSSTHDGTLTSGAAVSFTIDQLDPLVTFIRHRFRSTTPAENARVTLIFWSSRDSQTGKMWCPDCEEMEINLNNVLKYHELDSITTPGKKDHEESAEAMPAKAEKQCGVLAYIYVGDRDQWKSSDNPFKQSPWNLTKIPTVLKLRAPPSGNPNDELSLYQNEKLVEEETFDFKTLLEFLA